MFSTGLRGWRLIGIQCVGLGGRYTNIVANRLHLRHGQRVRLVGIRLFHVRATSQPTQTSQTVPTQPGLHVPLPTDHRLDVQMIIDAYERGRSNPVASSSRPSQGSDFKRSSFRDFMVTSFRAVSSVVFRTIAFIVLAVIIFSAVRGNGVDIFAPKLLTEEVEIAFDDIIGADEAKEELQTIVDFLKRPSKYDEMGCKLPRGCILSGPPGTGKTMLAKAVAREAGVNFISACGSDFDEMFVGLGARRMRTVFATARQRAPCVIFIDEIDTVGQKRSSNSLTPFANQTINQFLSELDGFISREGVVVIGATNRPSELDKALLRPGRFDLMIPVMPPDENGRSLMLEYYLHKVKFDRKSVDIDVWAKRMPGFTGADIANLVNNAAIQAVVAGKGQVTADEMDAAYDRILLGPHLKSRKRKDEDLRVTAYHEAGHALVAHFTPNAPAVVKITLEAKGHSGGHTAFLPPENEMLTKSQLLANMDVGMGGRAAEEILLGRKHVTDGATQDLNEATSIAENIVNRFGHSETIGPRIVDGTNHKTFGQQMGDQIDSEISTLLTDAYGRAKSILSEQRSALDALAKALQQNKILNGAQVVSIISENSPTGRAAS